MDEIEVINKKYKGTIKLLDDGSQFVTVEDIRVNKDYESAIANIKENEKSERSKAQRLLDCALRQTMIEMRKFECHILDKEDQELYMQEALQKLNAKDITDSYISKNTLEMLFYNVGYDCLKEYGKTNGEKQIALYTELIYTFITFLLKKRPCKELTSEISADAIEKIVRSMAIGKLQSKGFPYFLLFCVMLILLPENYIVCMYDDASRASKRERVIEMRNEIGHLYDYEYVLDNNYLVDKVKALRSDIFDIYFTVIDWFWNFVRTELINLKNQMGHLECKYQQLGKVFYKKEDMELEGYLYLYESFMESEHYWAKNNFNNLLEILKSRFKNLEGMVKEKVSTENSLNGHSVGKPVKRNRTKVDKYLVEIFERMMDYYEMEGERFYETKRSKYIKKSIYLILDILTKDQITGKKFPTLEKKEFDNKEQEREYTYAMKYVDCMLVYLVKCYEEELIPDIFERYCDAMIERYENTNVQSIGCDGIEVIINDLIMCYRIYEQEFITNAYVIIQELLLDDDVAEIVCTALIKHMWQSLFFEFDISLTIKEAYPDIEIGTLATEKDFISLSKKQNKLQV